MLEEEEEEEDAAVSRGPMKRRGGRRGEKDCCLADLRSVSWEEQPAALTGGVIARR